VRPNSISNADKFRVSLSFSSSKLTTWSLSFLTSSLSGASFSARLVRKSASPRARRASSVYRRYELKRDNKEIDLGSSACSARRRPRCAVRRALAGSTSSAVHRPPAVPLFSNDSETVTCDNGEIVLKRLAVE